MPADQVVGDVDQWPPEPAGGWSTGTVAHTTTMLRWGAWTLVAAGPLLAAFALLARPAPAPAPAPASGQPSYVDQSGPAGFAELYVDAYLRADESTSRELAVFYPPAAELDFDGEAPGRAPEQAAAVQVEQAASGYWSVTVAVRTTPEPSAQPASATDGAAEEAERAPVLRYFQVPVRAAAGGSWAAASLPAEVSVPAPGDAVALSYGQLQQATGSAPVLATLQGFFSSYLAGDGALERWLSPGTEVAPVAPAPYESVRVTQLAEVGDDDPLAAGGTPPDGQRRQLHIQVEAVSDGVMRPLAYALELAARDGRWEIRQVQAAPVLDDQGATDTGAQSTQGGGAR